MPDPRLQKFLSRCGAASRRAAERMILEGRVQLNGKIVSELGRRVDPSRDRVEVDGRIVTPSALRWILLNKPRGYVTTRSDPGRRPTVYDLLPSGLGGLPYVGRLDLETEGLLLFSNDGDLAHRLLHPSSGVEREYEVLVAGSPSKSTLRRLESGVELEDGPARALRAEPIGPAASGRTNRSLRLIIGEGRNREVRRLCEAIGHRALRLRRVRIGPIRLGALPPGKWRDLKSEEISSLRARVGGERAATRRRTGPGISDGEGGAWT